MKIQLKDATQFEELLIRNGFSKKAFAEAANIGQATVVQLCNGYRNSSPRLAKRICETLKVEFDDIFKIVKPTQSKSISRVQVK